MNEVRRLNIGCGDCPMEGYLNIDDCSDTDGTKEEMFEDIKKEAEPGIEVMMMDGNNMSFEDGMFDEVISNQCIGKYVTNYDEVLRVLKKNGRIWIGIWGDELSKLIYELLKRNVKITNVDLLNGSFDDGLDEVTFEVEGIKEA